MHARGPTSVLIFQVSLHAKGYFGQTIPDSREYITLQLCRVEPCGASLLTTPSVHLMSRLCMSAEPAKAEASVYRLNQDSSVLNSFHCNYSLILRPLLFLLCGLVCAESGRRGEQDGSAVCCFLHSAISLLSNRLQTSQIM